MRDVDWCCQYEAASIVLAPSIQKVELHPQYARLFIPFVQFAPADARWRDVWVMRNDGMSSGHQMPRIKL